MKFKVTNVNPFKEEVTQEDFEFQNKLMKIFLKLLKLFQVFSR